MHPMLDKLVSSEFMSENQAQIIEKAITEDKQTVIASGHRSAGVRPLLASIMTVAKTAGSSKQVKALEDVSDDVDYILLPGLAVENFEEYVQKCFDQKSPMITIKEPEHPYSMLKVMKKALKNGGSDKKEVYLLECRKIDDVPHLIDINKFYYDEKGKVVMEKVD